MNLELGVHYLVYTDQPTSPRDPPASTPVLGLHIHTCSHIFLWVLEIHTHVLVLAKQVLFQRANCPAPFTLMLSHLCNGRLLLPSSEPRLYQTPQPDHLPRQECLPHLSVRTASISGAQYLRDQREHGLSVFIDVVLNFTE